MALDVFYAPTDEDRVKRIEKFLEPLWRVNQDESAFRIASPELLPNHDSCLA